MKNGANDLQNETIFSNSNIKKDVGKKLLKLRKQAGLNQEVVAKTIGITRASLAYYEKGERSIPIDVFYNLSSFYEVSTDYLFGLSAKFEPQRNHIDVEEMSFLNFSDEVMDKLWGDRYFRDFINDLVSHKDFEKFEELTFMIRYSDYDEINRNYRSFLISQLLYSMISEIFADWWPDNKDINLLDMYTKKELLTDIATFVDTSKETE